MQLFTIGMYELHEDGTRELDASGQPIRSYSRDDVMEYARVWTGFRKQNRRGNIDDAVNNRIDPMGIEPTWRDAFPKMGLGKQYVGDGYPLCADMPQQHFLKRGAKYILLGYSPSTDLQGDPSDWDDDKSAIRFVADPAGELNSILCAADENSKCWYPPVVTLSEDLNCLGNECEVDTIHVVQVQGGVFYEYVRLPCVHQTFFANAQKVKKRYQVSSGSTAYMCADPRTAVASTACCFEGSNANVYESYWGERVKASTAAVSCAEKRESLCTTGEFSIQNCEGTSCAGSYFYWMSPQSPCKLKAKFDTNGKIAVVHELPDENEDKRERGYEEEDNKTFFRVQYLTGGNEVSSLIGNCNSNLGCSVSVDGYCMCDVTVTDEVLFTSIPTPEEVLSILTVEAFHPDILDGSFTTTSMGAVTVYARNGIVSDETIFEVVDELGIVRRRKNVLSVVRIAATDISFRNPVQFISLTDPTLRDAQYETDAAIDHFLYHRNTAPFLAISFAKRFGISNPSPRYVKTIAEAFRKGTYHSTNGNFVFGEGSCGDLAATVAATILDREARNVVLDADPVHGNLKEPALKLIGLMRNLEFHQTIPEFPFPRFSKVMQETIGQMVYNAPSIFSFFNPYFQPSDSRITEAGLVAPEAEVLSDFNILGLMNGFLAMIKYGLDRCFGGFGETLDWAGGKSCENRVAGEYISMSSKPGFIPDDASSPFGIVDDLSTIMTSGRLSPQHRESIMDLVGSEKDPLIGIIKAEQLIASSAEFHSTGTVVPRAETRVNAPEVETADDSYKALVVLMLGGGCDSYNLVVPHTCSKTNDQGLSVLDQYISERAEVGLNGLERKLEIDARGQAQPCERFSVHDKLPVLQDLYNEGDLTFFLNAGMLNELADRETWNAVTSSRLFDSNAMLREAQRIDPYGEEVSTGVLARLSHLLNSDKYGFHAQTLSINELHLAVKGNGTMSPAPVIINEDGPPIFNDKPDAEEYDPLSEIKRLNQLYTMSSSIFGEFWSKSLTRALEQNDMLTRALSNATLTHSCGSNALNMVARLLQTREDRGSDRDMYYVHMDGWDHHTDTKTRLDRNFEQLNDGLACFVKNIKDKDLWNKVTLLVVSEFGRTLSPINNYTGTGDGWAGHYFALGGALRGGMFGEYPSDLTATSPLNAGSGRMIPTLSWESIWFAMSGWLGITNEDDLHVLLPNARGTRTRLLRKDEVFEAGL